MDELQHFAVGLGDFITVLQSLHSIVAAVLAHHLLGLAHVAGDWVVTRPELYGVEQ